MYKTFETEHRVRPDDIDMFQHVHNSKYLDYVLARPLRPHGPLLRHEHGVVFNERLRLGGKSCKYQL